MQAPGGKVASADLGYAGLPLAIAARMWCPQRGAPVIPGRGMRCAV